MSRGLVLNAVRGLSDPADSGIYVLEGLSKGQPIPVRRETVVAFLGSAPRGPVGIPIKIKSVDEYEKRFGSANKPSCLHTLLKQFFDNGAVSAIVVRVFCSSRRNQIFFPGPSGPLVLSATNPGPMEYLRASVDYDGIPESDHNRFNLVIHRLASAGSPIVEEQEIFSGLSLNPESPNYATHVLLDSGLVFMDSALPGERPECTLARGIEVGKSYVYATADWPDPEGISDYDLIGCETDGTGLSALNQVPVIDFICPVPDKPDLGPVALFAAERYCRKRCAVLATDPPSGWKSVADVVQSSRQNQFSSANLMTYYPRPVASGEDAHASALGAILGRFAAEDAEHGVWKAPSVDAAYADQIGISCRASLPLRLSAQDCAVLARKGVNSLLETGSGTLTLRGLVTFSRGEGVTAAWDNLRKRRIALLIIESIARATRWTVFQDDGTEVWTLLDKQVHDFLRALHAEGALAGETAGDAFYLMSDSDPGDSSARVRFLVGFALGDHEFYTFRFTHDRVDCEVREVAWQPGIALAS